MQNTASTRQRTAACYRQQQAAVRCRVLAVFCIALFHDATSSVEWLLQLFKHIMEIDREVYWEYANVTCAGYPLQHIDTISDRGEVNTNSVMYKVVYGVTSPLAFFKRFFSVGNETEQLNK